MLTLAVDIVNDSILVAHAARECAIFLAPSAEHGEVNLLFRPLAAALLDVSHQVAECHRRRQLNKHVYVVAYAANAVELAVAAVDD